MGTDSTGFCAPFSLARRRQRFGRSALSKIRRLQTWFDRKACRAPDELADETLNRVARRLETMGAITGVTSAQFCYLTAKYVWLETLRQPQFTALPEDELSDRAASDTEAPARETRLICLESCLARLAAEDRTLMLRYYIAEQETRIRQRQVLAASLGVSANALSLRVFRLRARLEACVRECLDSN